MEKILMRNYASGVNPTILKWAREKAGYSIEDIARSFGKDVEIIRQWELGEALPTYGQLEKISYSLYKRPIALFFFPEPPREPDPDQSFRTLPDFEIKNLSPNTRRIIREAYAMQITLLELNDGKNLSEKYLFRDIQFNPLDNPFSVAMTVRNYLDIQIGKQIKWPNAEEALKNWRRIVEDGGIFIFKDTFEEENVSGFCLIDNEFPLIYLNNSTAKTRQIFTIFHELAHILLGINGITKIDDRYIFALSGDAHNIEVFCNRFASEFLVPSDDFDNRIASNEPLTILIKKLANHYKVSREVILRKFLDRQIVSSDYYQSTVYEWLDEYRKLKKGKKGGGGDYYATVATYLGDKFLRTAFSKYYQGRCTIEQLADYTNIKANNIAGLEQFVMKRTPAQ
jgi:Zn-dependent peptidase ImmA (M78 family)/transcriptional regulator with XRE-family HTH domain